MGSYLSEAFKNGGWYVFPLKKSMVFIQICLKESQQDTQVGESYGKQIYTKDIIGLQCKGMLKTLSKSVKNAKGERMKYTLAIKVFIQLWLCVLSTIGDWILQDL